MVDVLILGAGPAGSSAAVRLARAGWRVLAVDRCRFPRPKPCGEYYNPECCRLLRELGILPAVMAAGARVLPELVLRTPGGRLTYPLERVAPPGDHALSLGRETLDGLLVRAAREAGAEVREGVTVREPLLEGGRVVGALVREDGRDQEVRARVTLAADGLRSRFARRLGLAAGDGGRRKLGLAARYRAVPGAAERVEMHGGGPGCCGISLRGAEANLGMVTDASRARELGGDPGRFFREALHAYPELVAAVEGDPISVRAVGPLTWRTRRQSTAGCLLLGDAAGFYDPFTGQGVTFALLTAELAAEVAGAALARGDLSGRRLAEYSRQRAALLGPRVTVQRVIQAVLERPRLLDRVLHRLNDRPEVARTLVGVVADVLPAARAFDPRFLAGLLA